MAGFGHGSDIFFKSLIRPLVMGGFMSASVLCFRAFRAPDACGACSRRGKYQVVPAARVSGGFGHGAWPCVGPRRRAEGARPL